jgi:hypothetical protein
VLADHSSLENELCVILAKSEYDVVAARATLSECLKRMAAALAEHPLGRRRAGANK